jgi:hypothetical protein
MKFRRLEEKPLSRLLLKRSVIFLTIFNGIVLFLYIIGNYQKFLDATQMLLLHILSFSFPLLALLAVFGVVQSLLTKRVAGLIAYCIIFILNTLLTVLLYFLICMIGGTIHP